MTDRACPTCSGATDIPDGKGGIMPCPECQRSPRAILETIAATDPDRAADARARLDCLWDDLN